MFWVGARRGGRKKGEVGMRYFVLDAVYAGREG